MKKRMWLLGGMCWAVAAQAQSSRPNILLILADDMRGTTLGVRGTEPVSTPHLDALAEESVLFSNAHIMGGTSGAVSMPSRAMLMTGKYLYSLEKEGAKIPEEQTTLGEALRKSGYETVHIGKWHSDYGSFNRTFSDGEDIFFGGMADHWNVPLYHYSPDGKYGKKRPVLKDFSHSNRVEYQTGEYLYSGRHSVDIFTESACRFLRSREAEEAPFFLSLAYMSPHDPRTMPKEFEALYEGDTSVALPANFMERHPFDNGELVIRDERLAATPRNGEEMLRHIRQYYAMISHLDDRVGQVIEALKASGAYDNTVIVFAADNGLAVGQHGLMGKQNVYEHSVGIPLMIKPAGRDGIEPGENDCLCYLIDLFPTLCDLTGTPVPESVDGVSLLPVLQSGKPVREYLYYAYRDTQRAVSDGAWKLIEYHVEGTRTTQLFDLEKDPMERENLSEDKRYASVIRRLRKQMEIQREATRDTSVFWQGFVF